MKFKAIFIIAVLFNAMTLSAYADTIYLKNGRTMDGIIKEENRAQVLLDVGFGTITITKDEIEKIARSGPQEKGQIIRAWQDKYAETGRWIPRGAEGIFTEISELKKNKEDVIDAKKTRDRFQDEIDAKEKEVSDFYDRFEDLNKRLAAADKQDVFNYNKLVAQVNAESAKVGKLTGELKAWGPRKRELETAFSDCLNNYISKLSFFTKYFNEEYEKLSKLGIKEEDAGFYKWARQEIDDFSKDFEHREINFSKNASGIIVSATLNGKTTALLVVDTGASLVVISAKTARAMGIEMRGDDKKIELTLADNKKTTAIPVVLDSVEVGGFQAFHVTAAVTDESPAPGIEGLLGMSFLGNFIVKIDSNGNKLILERFNSK